MSTIMLFFLNYLYDFLTFPFSFSDLATNTTIKAATLPFLYDSLVSCKVCVMNCFQVYNTYF